MLGKEVAKQFPSAICRSRSDYDILDYSSLASDLYRNQPSHVINCVAYTNVDGAEDSSDKAYDINGKFPGVLAKLCMSIGARTVHISTDYVFDGYSTSPYKEGDQPGPLSVYGDSKLDGECNVLSNAFENHLILRTSWLYGDGHCFPRTIIKLASEKDEIKVVDDQVGCPTYSVWLAMIIRLCVEHNVRGLYHAVNRGQVSWYEFARMILTKINSKTRVLPVPTDSWPTKATRPKYSVLDTTKLETFLGIPFLPLDSAISKYLTL